VASTLPPSQPPQSASALTRRQREIAGLLAQGLTNAEIAEQLVLTTGTVANHVAGILQRLNLETRTQVATWAVEQGLHGRQDRLLTTLERLLELSPMGLQSAMNQAAQLVAGALGADNVEALLYEPSSQSLVVVGTSGTDLSHKEQAAGLDRLPLAGGGRVVEVFQSGQPHRDGDVRHDLQELVGIRHELQVRSQMAVPLAVEGVRRGALMAQSRRPSFFTERDMLFLQAVSRWVGSVVRRVEQDERNAAAAIEHGRRLAAAELAARLVPLRERLDQLRQRAEREQQLATAQEAIELGRTVERLERLLSDVVAATRLGPD
jgi:two-component system, OmpR family, sensor kinase